MMFQNFYPNKLIRSVYETELGRIVQNLWRRDLPTLTIRWFPWRSGRRGGDPAFCPDPQPWHEDHAGIQQRRSAG